MNVSRCGAASAKKVILAVLAVLAITACQDVVSAPQHQMQHQMRVPHSLPSFVVYTAVPETTLTYDPQSGLSAQLGQIGLYMAPGTVCDPATSGYGPTYWDSPCTPLQDKITISATVYVNTSGLPYVEFYPALRFARSASGQLPMLFVFDSTAADNPFSEILYCGDVGCIDESKSDSSLAVVFNNGYIYRPLKHFSGYNVAAGYNDSTSSSGTGF